MDYNFIDIEKKWQDYWSKHQTFKAINNSDTPKYYVLDMFPYPSGQGLHVGHPLGYIASDIFSRFKRLCGYNVLHPMGYDAFGLPAEQYAIQTGLHPALTTEKNVKRYREQLDKIGFSFDWSREVKTCDPDYYKWTQWIFIQLFNSWYNLDTGKAEPITTLISGFESNGNAGIHASAGVNELFTAAHWNSMSEKNKEQVLLNYRLAYLSDTRVNWCPELGTALANEEVKDGLSERGGFPVERKLMKQWSLRITAYADRLLERLDKINWPDSLKEMQRNWIGRSEGASIHFKLQGHDEIFEVFTTRPDTVFGATFMVLAPEHKLVAKITATDKKKEINDYVLRTKNRSERERISEVKKVSGVFTGGFAIHPFSGEKIPVWISDYVLAGYGTGAIMAVPSGDQRDWDFAKHFNLPIVPVISDSDPTEGANENKDGVMINSGFLNGLKIPEAIKSAIAKIEETGIGTSQVNYKLRDSVFSRQRYWGEPFPVYYRDGVPYVLDEKDLPLKLPEVDKYLPSEKGDSPLARAKNWHTKEGFPLECNTMPGWAGSSWYYLRYMDASNAKKFVSKEAVNYWQNVDLYIGGAEHATGHLLYVRFWTKFLYDLGYLPFDEPAKKLVNQGMIQGVSEKAMINTSFTGKLNHVFLFTPNLPTMPYINPENPQEMAYVFYSYDIIQNRGFEAHGKNVPIEFVKNSILDKNRVVELEMFWGEEYKNSVFVCEGGYWYKNKFYRIGKGSDEFFTKPEVEKMSKSKFNVVNPDDVIEKYGADTFRMYEMFLGPIEQSKPWDTNGIEGVHKFLRRFWRLFHDDKNNLSVSEENPSPAELKVIHKTIKKIKDDIEKLSLNTAVSAFMICVNELIVLKCNKRKVLEDLVVILSPFAPHITEEVWSLLGHEESVSKMRFPAFNDSYLKEDTYTYPISFNGKTKFKLDLPLSLSKKEIEQEVLAHDMSKKWLNGKDPKKIIVVERRIVNVVV